MTNATKATIIGILNAGFGLAVAFDIALTAAQQGAFLAFVNLALTAAVGLTYKDSPKRIPDDPAAAHSTR